MGPGRKKDVKGSYEVPVTAAGPGDLHLKRTEGANERKKVTGALEEVDVELDGALGPSWALCIWQLGMLAVPAPET